MSHFAQIKNNIVQQVIVAEQEFIDSGVLGEPSEWIQTSYNTRGGVHYNSETGKPSEDQSKALRKNYAAIGFIYDPSRDAFIPPKPYNSWILDDQTCLWKAPIDLPADAHTGEPEKIYIWDESSLNWKLLG